MISKRLIGAILTVGVALPTGLTAEILKLPDGATEVLMAKNGPARGMSMPQVEQRFGAPANRVAAVGEPPIARWDYQTYSVYFEHDKVLHAVTRQSN